MRSNSFDTIAKERSSFLIEEYSCVLLECVEEDWEYKLIYQNKTTYIKVVYEFREAYIFITHYQLLDGKFIENPRNIEDKTVLYGYGLDDIINTKDSSALIKPAYQYGDGSEFYNEENGMMLYCQKIADNLRKYGSDVLSGNFSIFAKRDKNVKERARKCR